MNQNNYVEVRNVSKSFRISKRQKGILGSVANLLIPRYEKKVAVQNISFSISQGEMVGFVGPNGAGKSTMIKMLSGILYPENGSILVNGLIPYKQRKEYVKKIGVVFGQKSQLQWDLPVIDSFELLKAIYRIPEEVYQKNLRRFTEMLEMDEFLTRPVRQLSLGQRMRADIVAALLHSPQIVFFDEPTIGVDVVGKDRIRQFMKELNEQDNITMIFTTHDMQDIEKTCNRLIIIDQGNKIYDDSIYQLRERYGTFRQVEVEFENDYETMSIENVLVENISGASERRKRFSFDNTIVKIDDLLDQLLKNYLIKDINISEPDIEEIIGRIYVGEV